MAVPVTGDLDKALAVHLSRLKGVLGCHLALRSGDAPWQEAGRLGFIMPEETEAAVAAFDPAATGGKLKPVTAGRARWLAGYATRGATLDLVLTLPLAEMPGEELQQLLARIEDKVGWVLVAAERQRARAGEDRQLSVTLGAALLKEAAEARNSAALRDQWIARLELAFAADALAVCTVRGDVPRLAAVSGGGLIVQPSLARSALERLAETTIAARTPRRFGSAADTPQEAEALETLGAAQVLSIPVYEGDPCRAVVLALWVSPEAHVPDRSAADLVGQVLGETLAIHARARPSLLRRLGNWLGGLGFALFGRRHRKLKLFALLTALALGAAAYTPARHEPAFNARIEARDRKVVSAPFDGFVSAAPLKIGDRVAPGALVLRLDDSEYRLERSRAASELDRLTNAAQQARGKRDTAQLRNIDAQIAQSTVELALLDAQIARAEVLAETPGLVISGDGWRRIGARVRLGEPLVELARPESMAVLGYLDEDWVADLPEGAAGRLLLAAFPDRPIAVTLERVTPQAEQVEGTNAFLAWFTLSPGAETPALMDGMRGIVVVEAGETSLLGKYGRGLGRWVARKLWRWS